MYVILDIEYPRAGLIRLEGPDQVLLNVLDRMRCIELHTEICFFREVQYRAMLYQLFIGGLSMIYQD